MAIAMHDPDNPATDHPAERQHFDLRRHVSPPWHKAAEADDLERLQSCLDWLNRERALLALETEDRRKPRRLPRAAQLELVPGIAPPAPEPAPGIAPPVKVPEHRREGLPIVPAPPLACDRLQPPPERPRFSGTMLAALLAAAVAGSLAYRISEGFFSVPSAAQAASIETVSP
jgi:hypothetical protein